MHEDRIQLGKSVAEAWNSVSSFESCSAKRSSTSNTHCREGKSFGVSTSSLVCISRRALCLFGGGVGNNRPQIQYLSIALKGADFSQARGVNWPSKSASSYGVASEDAERHDGAINLLR